MRSSPATPQRILIIRLSAIGDVVMASGLIARLRAAYPEASLSWLAQPGPAELVAAHPDLDAVLIWPVDEWRALWRARRWRELARAVRAFVRDLRARCFDWVIDAHGLLKSGVWARASGAPVRLGLASREGSRHLMTRVIARVADDRRIGSEYIGLLRGIGVDPGDFPLAVATTKADRARARSLRVANGVGERYAAIAPFTTRPQKHWFERYWAKLVDALAGQHELPVVMLGGPGDGAAAARIVAEARGPICNLVGETSLRESMALIERAALLVGVDTGLTHMGSAARCPTVALFGATRPYIDPGVASTRVIYDDMTCAPCRFSPTCGGRYTCMRRLTPARVVAVVDTLLPAAT